MSRATRTAAARDREPHIALCADGVGLWTPWIAVGQVVDPGAALGVLEVLGQAAVVVSGATRSGRAVAVTGATHHRHPVDHGAALVTIDPAAVSGAAPTTEDRVAQDAQGLLRFHSPSSGRYYGRPAPTKPPFVSPGDVIHVGQTVALIEVMKTFHRVTYGGAGLPEQARVMAIPVVEESEVNAGDVLLVLEAV